MILKNALALGMKLETIRKTPGSFGGTLFQKHEARLSFHAECLLSKKESDLLFKMVNNGEIEWGWVDIKLRKAKKKHLKETKK